jgi:hypothetical protein
MIGEDASLPPQQLCQSRSAWQLPDVSVVNAVNCAGVINVSAFILCQHHHEPSVCIVCAVTSYTSSKAAIHRTAYFDHIYMIMAEERMHMPESFQITSNGKKRLAAV